MSFDLGVLPADFRVVGKDDIILRTPSDHHGWLTKLQLKTLVRTIHHLNSIAMLLDLRSCTHQEPPSLGATVIT